MVYSDGIHLIASSIKELHEFAEKIGLKKHFFENPKKKNHPHYDLTNVEIRRKAFREGAVIVSSKEIVKLCRLFYGEREK